MTMQVIPKTHDSTYLDVQAAAGVSMSRADERQTLCLHMTKHRLLLVVMMKTVLSGRHMAAPQTDDKKKDHIAL